MDVAVAAVGVVSAAGALHDLKAYTVECCHGAVWRSDCYQKCYYSAAEEDKFAYVAAVAESWTDSTVAASYCLVAVP